MLKKTEQVENFSELINQFLFLLFLYVFNSSSNFSTTANIYAHLDSNSKQLSAQVITSAFETKKEIEESDSTISYDELALEN